MSWNIHHFPFNCTIVEGYLIISKTWTTFYYCINFNFYVTIEYNWNVKYLRVLKGVNRFSKIIFFIFLKQNTIHTSSILMYCLYMNLKIVTNGVQDRFTTLAMPSDVLWGIPQHTHTCTHPHTHIYFTVHPQCHES